MMRDWHELVSKPCYSIKSEKNVRVTMRDGVKLRVDIYYPDAPGKFPTLLAISPYGKELQALPAPVRPYSPFHGGESIEAGKTEFWVSRGYVHVIADTRGSGYSEGEYCFYGRQEHEDGYDLVEWIALQPWSDGNVGMIGMSAFAIIQYHVAAQNPPHLKAIAPCEGLTDRYRQTCYHGGILNYGFYKFWWHTTAVHTFEPISRREWAKEELNLKVEALKNQIDFKSIPAGYLPLICPANNPLLFDLYLHPYDGPFYWERSAYQGFDRIKVPVFILNRWTGWSIHLAGAFSAYEGIQAPKKMVIFTTQKTFGPDRPWSENHDEILRWYDHWLKKIDTGLMEEPPIKIWVQGAEKWRFEKEWPLARTEWTKFYLRENGRLQEEPPQSDERPDSFVNRLYWDPKEEIPCAKYTTERFIKNVEITGPIALYLKAALSTKDANWMVDIKDIGEDGSERLVTRGWLKASHRAIDQNKSKPYQPFHPHTESITIKPNEIVEYAIEIRETSYVFKAGHSLKLIIKGEDSPYEDPLWFHLPNMRETRHTLYHNSKDVSYLLLPIIPA